MDCLCKEKDGGACSMNFGPDKCLCYYIDRIVDTMPASFQEAVHNPSYPIKEKQK